jgi:hypothetical protein
MVLYNFTNVKKVLGETGTTNNEKIHHYGDMADSVILGDTINVKNLPYPPVVTADVLTTAELKQIKDFATQIAVGYFYKFESGDESTIEEAKANWLNWFNNKFRRFTFKTRGGELAN